MTMKMGSSSFDGGYQKTEYFKLEGGKDNVYRVLPPIFSLADQGKWAQYHATHSIWIDKRPYHFACIEERDRDKNIIVECPFCAQRRAAEAKLETVKANLTKEQIEAFTKAHIDPFKVDKKFYLNVINQANVPGLLDLGVKAFEALRGLLKGFYDKNGIDATSANNGYFLNFKKNQAYKGDRNTTYSVEFYQNAHRDDHGNIVVRYVNHTITPELINEMSVKSKDLATLFTRISKAEIEMLVNAVRANDLVNLKALCERVFSRSSKAVPSVNTSIPGTTATAVNSIVQNGSDFVVQPAYTAPVAPSPVASQPPAPAATGIPWESPSKSETSVSDDFFSQLMNS